MPSVNFLKFKLNLASARYRGAIPEQALRKLGYPEGKDVIVVSKHGWDWSVTEGYKRIVFDVCDDHFSTPREQHYRMACEKADLITCSTDAMRQIIKRETGKDAVVIPDPYEQPEKKARISDTLLWFGHPLNLPDLEREAPRLQGHRLIVVTNAAGAIPWSPANMDKAFNDAGLVIIPTGRSIAKSANRAVESIRRGLFVVANPLPAYSDLGIWLGDIPSGVEWALNHRGEVIKRIKYLQDYVRHQYSPQRIGKLWKTALFD